MTGQTPRRVLVPVMAGIGNALMTQPMIRQLVAGLPEAEIHVVSRLAAINACFADCGVASTGLVNIKAARVHETFSTMRAFQADTIVLPFPSNRWQYALLARLARPRRVVMHRYPVGKLGALGFLPADRVRAERGIHDVVQNNKLLRPLGVVPDDALAPRWEVEADEKLAETRPVVIHAGCGLTALATGKRWPPERFARVIEHLRDTGLPVLIIEGPDERGVGAAINEHLADPAEVRLLDGPLEAAAVVLKAARLYVGTDSGLGHLAAAVGTPPVTLFSVADPDRVCPFGYRDLVVTPSDYPGGFPDAPYPMDATKPKADYPEPRAIEFVRVEDVVERALSVNA